MTIKMGVKTSPSNEIPTEVANTAAFQIPLKPAKKNADELIVAELLGVVFRTIAEVAEITKIPVKAVERWIELKKIRVHRGARNNSRIRVLDLLEVFEFLRSSAVHRHRINAVDVLIENIVEDARYQVRDGLMPWLVSRYRRLYETDRSILPPILIVEVDQVKFVVDGWHRLAGAKKAGYTSIPTFVHKGDHGVAAEYAWRANLRAAVPLSNTARSRVLRKFLTENPKVKAALLQNSTSLREMSRIFGFSKSALHRAAQETKMPPSKEVAGELSPPCAPVVFTAESLFDRATEQLAALKLNDGDQCATHRKAIAQIAFDCLTWLGQEAGQKTPAELVDVRRILSAEKEGSNNA